MTDNSPQPRRAKRISTEDERVLGPLPGANLADQGAQGAARLSQRRIRVADCGRRSLGRREQLAVPPRIADEVEAYATVRMHSDRRGRLGLPGELQDLVEGAEMVGHRLRAAGVLAAHEHADPALAAGGFDVLEYFAAVGQGPDVHADVSG